MLEIERIIGRVAILSLVVLGLYYLGTVVKSSFLSLREAVRQRDKLRIVFYFLIIVVLSALIAFGLLGLFWYAF